jgi:hypothetical protein
MPKPKIIRAGTYSALSATSLVPPGLALLRSLAPPRPGQHVSYFPPSPPLGYSLVPISPLRAPEFIRSSPVPLPRPLPRVIPFFSFFFFFSPTIDPPSESDHWRLHVTPRGTPQHIYTLGLRRSEKDLAHPPPPFPPCCRSRPNFWDI